ncbi:anthranilate synthase component I family protein [Taibaiella koreensis]|uniref:anthranilate synthase component I family protein n=1 Tax=Taibaiella koreensis TaxID=1268548 RepID=UPI000E59956A|nr:anthranilate synthase component I family protein [Taibaiella koreensis]
MTARTSVTYSFAEEDLSQLKNKMLNWLRPFSIFAYLDNNSYNHAPVRFELLAGAGMIDSSDHMPDNSEDWYFGHLCYDYKNHVEPKLSSRHPHTTGFDTVFFFCPETVVYIPAHSHTLHVATVHVDPAQVLAQILSMPDTVADEGVAGSGVDWQYRFGQEDYLDCIAEIRRHIEEGDCYELNFCTEAYATVPQLDPVYTFTRLNTVNPAPFAALYRNEASWLVCASPERFLFRQQDRLVSQPIKGTVRRSSDPVADEDLKRSLRSDPKERAENVMIVDLVRNDLARSCKPGTVAVPELFGVYSFPQVHQLISTVSGECLPGVTNRQIIDAAFPMGSMTGAPKVMVMELIEQYERSRRALYSGTIGYMMPSGDFDFNVVIRSLVYHAAKGYLSYHTGGAITYESLALAEWEETRLKAKAMEQIFL